MSHSIELERAAAWVLARAEDLEQRAARCRALAARYEDESEPMKIASAVEDLVDADVLVGEAEGLRELLRRAGFPPPAKGGS